MAWIWLLWLREKKKIWFLGVLFGLTLAFAIFSKGSAYPIAFPFVCVIAWYCLRKPRSYFLSGLIAAIIIIAINAPHLYRTFISEGNIVAGGDRNILKHPTPQTFLNNLVYNFVSNHPVLLAGAGTEALEKFSAKLGIQQDDLEIFPFGGIEHAQKTYTAQDAYTPIVGQSILILFVFIGALKGKFRVPWTYFLCLIAAFFLFNLVLTWHAWVSRIQVSLFFLAAPVAGLYIGSLKSLRIQNYILCALCFLAIVPLFACVERPLISKKRNDYPVHFLQASREETLFNFQPDYRNAYTLAADYIAATNADTIGINVGTNGLEYPLWQMLHNRMRRMPKIEWVVPCQKDFPRYVFEFERIEQENPTSPPRVLKYENGKADTVFMGDIEERN